MQIPASLYSLVDDGIIEQVIRPLMSGKEAQVYLVVSGGEQRVAKIYKEAQDRTFQKRAEYTEGRKVRNSRDQRAMNRGSRHGRAQHEAAWRTTEVDMIYKLRDAGVRVPTPHHFIDGVLIMELVRDAEGYPAPRLGDLRWTPDDALAVFQQLLGEVVRMLCAGVVHGDLSDFNVLMGADGPVVIDFPQAVDASSNQNARKLLLRDVANLHRFVAKFAPGHAPLPYAEEMWELYKRNALTPQVRLTGRYRAAQKPANTKAVVELIEDAARDERRRREKLGLSMRGAPTAPVRQGEHASGRGGRPEAAHDRGSRHEAQRDPRTGAVARRDRGLPSHDAGHQRPHRSQEERGQPPAWRGDRSPGELDAAGARRGDGRTRVRPTHGAQRAEQAARPSTRDPRAPGQAAQREIGKQVARGHERKRVERGVERPPEQVRDVDGTRKRREDRG